MQELFKCFSNKNVWTEHEEVCLSINGAQYVRLDKGATDFKNYFKRLPVPFKVYADFESNLKSVESYEGSYSKKHQDHIPCSFATNLFVLMINLASRLLFLEVKMLLINLLKQLLKSMNTIQK